MTGDDQCEHLSRCNVVFMRARIVGYTRYNKIKKTTLLVYQFIGSVH